jgi:hypothetical protein
MFFPVIKNSYKKRRAMRYLKKIVINPDRIRKIPSSFSWIDRRFMCDGYLQQLCQESVLLYFFLIIVGDHQGLSFYGDQRICQALKLSSQALERGRNQLVIQNLIAYQAPMYQVLSLSPARRGEPPAEGADVGERMMSIKNIMASSFGKFV